MGTIHSVVVPIFLLHLQLLFPACGADKPNAMVTSPYYKISIEVTGAVGPETTAFDCQGRGPYAGISDGRVLRWNGRSTGWSHFATASPNWNHSCLGTNEDDRERMCGRPLGLKFNRKTCQLYIADAYYGLNVVGPSGGKVTQLANKAEGIPFKFTNALDIDEDTGVVYFTDTSTVYSRMEYEIAMETEDKTGRLMSYNLQTGKIKVLLTGLAFANGVALSKDKSFLLVAETTTGRVLKYWLSGHCSEVFIQLGGRPDNINVDEEGNFWIAQVPLPPVADVERPFLTVEQGVPVKVDESGRVLEVLNGTSVENMVASDVKSAIGRLWVGSVVYPYVAFKKLQT